MIVDGNRIRFRQSWLDTAGRCPEDARLSIVRPDLSGTTDEAVIGTAAHHGIELAINGEISYADIGDAVVDYYRVDPDGEVASMRFTKRADVSECIDLSVRCAQAWVTDLAPHFNLENARTEVKFGVDLFEYRDHIVGLEGTVDLAPDTPNELDDWKTAASEFKQKDKQKWATQPTAYGMAAVMGAIRSDVPYSWPITFRYGVMVKRVKQCRGQIVEVQRTEAHAEFLMKRMRTWVDMYLDFGLDNSWPLIDEGNWLCSAKWCDFYDICRGAHISSKEDLFGWKGASS